MLVNAETFLELKWHVNDFFVLYSNSVHVSTCATLEKLCKNGSPRFNLLPLESSEENKLQTSNDIVLNQLS